MGHGRYRIAEACLLRARRAGGDVADEATRLLQVLYWISGRRDQHRAILHARAEQEADPAKTLRVLWITEHGPYPVDGITAALAKARQSSPDDDMVWLALADLAIRTGRFDEAREWLDRCEKAQPDDPAVWKARLEWAKAVGRPDEVRRAAPRLIYPPRACLGPGCSRRGPGWRPGMVTRRQSG
jgi:Flp pilus assembly protein TadD